MNKWIFSILIAACLLFSGVGHAMCGGGVAIYHKGSDGWYYDRQKVLGADSESFHVLPGPGSDLLYNPCMRDSGYAADRLHVYRRSNALPDADPASFSYLADGYSQDATHVYYLEAILKGADVKTFRQIASGFFFKDSTHVYLNGVSVKNAGPATLLPLRSDSFPGAGLARDSAHVFWDASAVANANPKDARSLGRQYWTSNRTIFLADKQLTQVDFATFSVAGDDERAYSAEDTGHYFLGSRALNKSECRKVGLVVLACKNFIFASSRKYSQIDAASLHSLGMFPRMCQVIEGSLIYQDDHGIYEFYGDGTIMKFLSFQPDRRFESLDKTLEDRLCDHPITQSLKVDQ
jgi:DKNYY family